jgi:ankyrin repeat protein
LATSWPDRVLDEEAIVSSKTLPNPSLPELQRQAIELQKQHRLSKVSAAARIAAHHPRFAGHASRAVLDAQFQLADAQLVIAREYGFRRWDDLASVVDASQRIAKFKPHPWFDDALKALESGDIDALRALLAAHPELARARTNLDPKWGYFAGATLLHHVAWNPGRESKVPPNIPAIAELLLERGAEVDAVTLGRNGGTTMGLVITSHAASAANASGPLMDVLLKHGATLDLGTSDSVIPDWGKRNPLDVALANHATRAAEKMIELGARPDICSAAALGRLELVRGMFDESGHVRSLPVRHGVPLPERDAIGLAALFAYVNKHSEVVEFLLEKDGNWNMIGVNNGTLMHRAAWDGDLELVKRLVAKGADIGNRDNPFNSTPMSWAQHNKQHEVFEWFNANCAIDIHDAVGFNLREHVERCIRDDPSSVNRRIDHWEAPQSTPLYWAAWTSIQDVDGEHRWQESERYALVQLLLEHGADPNIVAGDGYTPLDVARTAGAASIAELIGAHGGKSSTDL